MSTTPVRLLYDGMANLSSGGNPASQPVGEKDWKPKFENWLIYNLGYVTKSRIEAIICYVEGHILPSKECKPDLISIEKDVDKLLASETTESLKKWVEGQFDELLEARKEIERLRGLITEAFFSFKPSTHSKDYLWKQFKKENNL